MPAITQPRAQFPFTGRRYGSFSGKGVIGTPDFMHGTIDIRPHLFGTMSVQTHLSGKLSVLPHLHGDIRTNP